VFGYTAAVIEKLNKAGAILVGKLAMVELAGAGGYRSASASATGPGLNPWNRARWSGGSSSGPGAAVAAGLTPFALGSETQGSILTPSAFCGVTGLRPTFGLVSRYGAMTLSWTMDKIGPMCRSADDCGLVLHEIAGKDGRDPDSAGRSFYYAPQWVQPLSKMRVGFAPADLEEWAVPAARPVFQAAFDVIRKLGARMTETALPDLPYGLASGAVIAAEGAAVFEPDLTSGKFDGLEDKSQVEGLKAGLDVLAKDYLKAQRIRTLVQGAFRNLFTSVDVLLSPTRFGPAPSAMEPFEGDDPGVAEPAKPGLSALIAASNLAGLPALSLPCGFVDGLPLAIQLVGPPFSENTLIAIGCEFQKATDWHKRRPAL
jgi:aspartyl-tRNA(Asn)/glutamyl-tRNA(Gln) amidotransferase subunit A